MSVAAIARRPGQAPHADQGASIFERVRSEVDLRLLVREVVGDYDEFARYDRVRCLSPDHDDNNGSMLVYSNGCYCMGCGARYSAVDIYLAGNPGANAYRAAEALLDGDYSLGKLNLEAREIRQLDPDTAVRYHLALFESPSALKTLQNFGFTLPAIQHFRLGLAQVHVRLDPDEEGFSEGLPDVSWFTDQRGKQIPTQTQWRFSVPVWGPAGSLRQIIYRKLPGALGSKTTLEKNAGVWLFNEPVLENKPEEVVFCEGWGDVIVFWQAGIAAVTSTAGAGHYSSEWTPKLKRVLNLWMLGDSDAAGQRMMRRVQKTIPWAKPLHVDWPVGAKDPRDCWGLGWRNTEFRTLLKGYTPWSARRRK